MAEPDHNLPELLAGQLKAAGLVIADAAVLSAAADAALAVVKDGLVDTLTLPLREALSLGSEVYSEITLREPTAGQLEEIAAVPAHKAGIKAVSLCGGVPETIVRQMKSRDFKKAENFVLSFM
jgi:hypothetical protein